MIVLRQVDPPKRVYRWYSVHVARLATRIVARKERRGYERASEPHERRFE